MANNNEDILNENNKLLEDKFENIKDLITKYKQKINLSIKKYTDIEFIEQIKDIITSIYNTEIFRIDTMKKILSNNNNNNYNKNIIYNNESQRLRILQKFVNSDEFIYEKNNTGNGGKTKKQRKTKKNKSVSRS